MVAELLPPSKVYKKSVALAVVANSFPKAGPRGVLMAESENGVAARRARIHCRGGYRREQSRATARSNAQTV